MDTERIKRRIRGLLNISQDDGASQGEIDNAMRLAAQLMNEHHVSQAEAEAHCPESRCDDDSRMGQRGARTVGSSYTTWEFTLAHAVARLVGSVRWHHSGPGSTITAGAFGTQKKRLITFYGAAEDAMIATEMQEEWAHVIATMATGKHGGCFRGAGAEYAHGFATGLLDQASRIDDERKRLPASGTSIVLAGKSLHSLLETKKDRAYKWLVQELGHELRKGKSVGRYGVGDSDAHAEGRADGRRAEGFQAKRTAKLS